MKKKIRFIINPISGIGRQNLVEALIEKCLDSQVFEYEITYTRQAGHAIELSRQATACGYSVVAIVGGDGSVNEAGQALIGSNTALAIIPAGSGNGVARHLKIPLGIEAAIKTINRYHIKRIDTGILNGMPFIGVAGVGFDAYISKKFSKYGKRGLVSYIRLVVTEYCSYKGEEYTLEVNNELITQRALLIACCNTSQYGNNAYIAPNADTYDGLLDISIIKKMSIFYLLTKIHLLIGGKIHKSQYVKIFRADKLTITQNSNFAHIDGEPIEAGNRIEIAVNPQSLDVIIPP